MKNRLTLLAAGALALLSTASLLAGLREALHRREKRDRAAPESKREAERRRIREALGDRLGRIDPDMWPAHLRPVPRLPDRDTARTSISPIDRPASVDIREDRDARG